MRMKTCDGETLIHFLPCFRTSLQCWSETFSPLPPSVHLVHTDNGRENRQDGGRVLLLFSEHSGHYLRQLYLY